MKDEDYKDYVSNICKLRITTIKIY